MMKNSTRKIWQLVIMILMIIGRKINAQIQDLDVRRDPAFRESLINTQTTLSSNTCYLNSFDTCFNPIVNDVLPFLQKPEGSRSRRPLVVRYRTLFDICQGYYQYKACLQGIVDRCFEYPNPEALVNAAAFSKAGTIEYTCNIVVDPSTKKLREFNPECRKSITKCFVTSLTEVASSNECQTWKNFQSCVTDYELNPSCKMANLNELDTHRGNVKKQITVACNTRPLGFTLPPNFVPPTTPEGGIRYERPAGVAVRRPRRHMKNLETKKVRQKRQCNRKSNGNATSGGGQSLMESIREFMNMKLSKLDIFNLFN